MNRVFCLAAMVCTVVLATRSQASISYSYVGLSTANNTSTVTVAPGTPVTFNVFLRETTAPGDSSLIVAENGLFGAGFQVNDSINVGAPAATITAIDGNTSATGFPGGLVTPNVVNTGDANLIEAVSNTATGGPQGATNGPTFRDVLLGTVNITASTAAGQSTTFNLGSFQDNTLTFTNGRDLDTTSTAPAYTALPPTQLFVNTTPVPEPASIGLVALGGVALLARRRSAR